MADDHHRQGYPQQGRPSTSDTARNIETPQPGMAASVTLPPMQADPQHHYPPGHGGAPPHPSASRGFPPDPRYAPSSSSASASSANGYSAPGGHYGPPPSSHGHSYPPGHPWSQGGQATQGNPQYDQRAPQTYGGEPYAHPGFPRAGPPQGPPPPGYPPHPGPYVEYAPQGGGPMGQAAPRQRTSIACKYCRKRKIRCSGYQSAPGGKCQNCSRMNQECVFQPVSATAATAFIPVSALSHPIPPGTQLFGPFGEPLAPYGHPSSQHPGHYGPPHSAQASHGGVPPPHTPGRESAPASWGPPGQGYPHPHGPPPGSQYYSQSLHSPTESYSSHGDARSDEAGHGGRPGKRPGEEGEASRRLPPPRAGASEEESRRRSPAEYSNHSSPAGQPQQSFPGARLSPHNPSLPRPSSASAGASSGQSTPARASAAPSGKSQVMSLSNLVDNSVDRGMIERLNRTRER